MTPEVERGAALLDEVRPGWFREIDVKKLDLSQATNCVLGQLYGNWKLAGAHFGWDVWSSSGDKGYDQHSLDYGFGCTYLISTFVNNRKLTPHWIEAINERLNPLVVPEEFVKEPAREAVGVG